MMPMFSTLWYASNRLRSCCARAKRTPRMPEVKPTAHSNQPHHAGGGAADGARMVSVRTRP